MDNLNQLIIIVTKNCNSKCIHCTYWKNKKKVFLKKDILFNTVLYFKKLGLKSVMLTGGEPLLHPKFDIIINFLKKNKIKIKIATNAIYLKKINLRTLKKIDNFSISLDSSNEKIYNLIRGVNKFEDVLKNILFLKKLKKDVKISFLIQKKNFKDIPAFLNLCNNLGIKNISLLVPNKNGDFNKLNYDGYQNVMLSKKQILYFEKNIIPVIIKNLKRYKIHCNYKPENINEISNYFKSFKSKRILPIRCHKCSVPIKSIVLRENGNFKPCLFMPYEYKNYKNNPSLIGFKNNYLFGKELFKKHCEFCLEVPLI